MPPQLRMFMRTTFIPASHALLPVPITYPRFAGALEAMHHDQRHGAGAVRLPVTMAEHLDVGSTRNKRSSGGGSWLWRGRKLPAIVCACPPTKPRDADGKARRRSRARRWPQRRRKRASFGERVAARTGVGGMGSRCCIYNVCIIHVLFAGVGAQ